MKYIKLLFPVLCLMGCSKITAENYALLSLGMDRSAVVEMLGTASQCDEEMLKTQSCIWQSGDKQIAIKFVADKVAFYSKEGF